MSVVTEKYIRKPLYVDAVRVTEDNFDDIVAWCQGEVEQAGADHGNNAGKSFIRVRVHNPKSVRQTQAFVGDWLLYTERGYKVYTNKAFHASFDKVLNAAQPVSTPLETDSAAQTQEESMARDKDWAAEPVDEYASINQVKTNEVFYREECTFDHCPAPDQCQGECQHPAATDPPSTIDQQPSAPVPAVSQEATPSAPVENAPSISKDTMILSVEDQKNLTPEEIRELVQSGEAVLAQDIPQL